MRKYKCMYKHCTHPQDLLPKEDMVQIGTRRYHKDCAETRNTIERCKKIVFDAILPEADYVETVGVLNTLIFHKKFDPEYIEFMLMWLANKRAKVKSPYGFHYTATNIFIKKDFNDPIRRQDTETRYAYRFG